MSRLRAVVVVAIGGLSVACGGEDPDAPESAALPEADATDDTPADIPDDPEWGLDFTITGRNVPMTARAELQVTEGEPVHVAITGRTSGTDIMTIDLSFGALEDALGSHAVEFSLPEDGAHIANGSLDGTWYYSQGGSITVSVAADGAIEGTFDIALARGALGSPGEPVAFEASAMATPLGGRFSGVWVLNCHSRLAGHSTLVVGGDYCESLDF